MNPQRIDKEILSVYVSTTSIVKSFNIQNKRVDFTHTHSSSPRIEGGWHCSAQKIKNHAKLLCLRSALKKGFNHRDLS